MITRHSRHRDVAAVLFLCLFASQAAAIALTPALADVARELDVTTATAGQVRTAGGLAAGVAALALARAGHRVDLRRVLILGSVLAGAASAATAAAPTFLVLAAAQIVSGLGMGVLATAGIAAAGEWVPREERARVLSWALIGMAAAWVAGMPLLGLLSEASWRYGALALPLPAAVAAAVAVARRPASAPTDATGGVRLVEAVRDGAIARWLFGELLANAAWIGTLVYVGALFTRTHGISVSLVGIVLALAGAAYIAGNLAFRRFAGERTRELLIVLGLSLGVMIPLIGAVRPNAAVSAAVLAAAAFLAGGRTLMGNAFALELPAEQRLAAVGVRGAVNQFGYFVGPAVGGVALATWSYAGWGLLLGAVAAAATLPLVRLPRLRARLRVQTAAGCA